MNILKKLLLLVLLSSISSTLLARDKDHFSVKLGVLQHENPAYEPSLNLNLTVGGKLLRGEYAALGLELEMSTTIYEGDTRTPFEEWEMDSHALYTTLHLGKNHYFKLKAGYIDWQVRYDVGDERNGTGPSWGIAYGYPLDSGNYVELEYTMMSDEQDFGIDLISLGYYF
jgi:hypothetical protein